MFLADSGFLPTEVELLRFLADSGFLPRSYSGFLLTEELRCFGTRRRYSDACSEKELLRFP
jgi:hypothetical protein